MPNDNCFILKQLEVPRRAADAVLDTDTFNEIDDQFALAYFMRSPERITPRAIYAAPFFNSHSSSPEDGMEKSYDEILNILSLCGRDDFIPNVFKGSKNYLPDEKTASASPAASDLAARAMNYTPDNPLYVLAIGAITNIASAILLNPEIISRIVVVWLGGNSHDICWPEFNMMQDIAAARVIFNSTVPFVQLPCCGVVSHLTTTGPELRFHLEGKSKIGDYLCKLTCKEVGDTGHVWSRVIWDISVVAWMLGLAADRVTAAPLPSYDNGYVFNGSRHFMKYVYWLNRDEVFKDLFAKLF